MIANKLNEETLAELRAFYDSPKVNSNFEDVITTSKEATGNFDTRKTNNRSTKKIDADLVEKLGKKGITIEQLEQLKSDGFPVYRYQTQVTIHGDLSEVSDDNYIGRYNVLTVNQNKTLGVKYNGIDAAKKKALGGLLYDYEYVRRRYENAGKEEEFWNYRQDSKGTVLNYRIYFTDEESFRDALVEIKELYQSFPFDYVLGTVAIYKGNSWGRRYLNLYVEILAMYEEGKYDIFEYFTKGRVRDEKSFEKLAADFQLAKDLENQKYKEASQERARQEAELKAEGMDKTQPIRDALIRAGYELVSLKKYRERMTETPYLLAKLSFSNSVYKGEKTFYFNLNILATAYNKVVVGKPIPQGYRVDLDSSSITAAAADIPTEIKAKTEVTYSSMTKDKIGDFTCVSYGDSCEMYLLPVKMCPRKPNRTPAVDAAPINGSACTVSRNYKENGIEMAFFPRPTREELDMFKAFMKPTRMIWNGKKKIWFTKYSDANWEKAQQFAKKYGGDTDIIEDLVEADLVEDLEMENVREGEVVEMVEENKPQAVKEYPKVGQYFAVKDKIGDREYESIYKVVSGFKYDADTIRTNLTHKLKNGLLVPYLLEIIDYPTPNLDNTEWVILPNVDEYATYDGKTFEIVQKTKPRFKAGDKVRIQTGTQFDYGKIEKIVGEYEDGWLYRLDVFDLNEKNSRAKEYYESELKGISDFVYQNEYSNWKKLWSEKHDAELDRYYDSVRKETEEWAKRAFRNDVAAEWGQDADLKDNFEVIIENISKKFEIDRAAAIKKVVSYAKEFDTYTSISFLNIYGEFIEANSNPEPQNNYHNVEDNDMIDDVVVDNLSGDDTDMVEETNELELIPLSEVEQNNPNRIFDKPKQVVSIDNTALRTTDGMKMLFGSYRVENDVYYAYSDGNNILLESHAIGDFENRTIKQFSVDNYENEDLPFKVIDNIERSLLGEEERVDIIDEGKYRNAFFFTEKSIKDLKKVFSDIYTAFIPQADSFRRNMLKDTFQVCLLPIDEIFFSYKAYETNNFINKESVDFYIENIKNEHFPFLIGMSITSSFEIIENQNILYAYYLLGYNVIPVMLMSSGASFTNIETNERLEAYQPEGCIKSLDEYNDRLLKIKNKPRIVKQKLRYNLEELRYFIELLTDRKPTVSTDKTLDFIDDDVHQTYHTVLKIFQFPVFIDNDSYLANYDGTKVDIIKMQTDGTVVRQSLLKGEYLLSDLPYKLKMAIKKAIDDNAHLFNEEKVLDSNNTPTPVQKPKTPLQAITQAAHDKFAKGEKFNVTFVKEIAEANGIESLSAAWEMVEFAYVLWYRKVANGRTNKEGFDDVVKFYQELQPSNTDSSSTKKIAQQYSTAAPISYALGAFCEVDKSWIADILEPSAGNGLLLINAPYDKTTVNEIDPTRLKHLKAQPFKAVLNKDAADENSFADYTKQMDVVLSNPPFSSFEHEVRTFKGSAINRLDDLMVMTALETMRDDGRAAFVVGGGKIDDAALFAPDGRMAYIHGQLWNWLFRHYNVMDIIKLSGSKLYSKQGTSFNVIVILINGRKQVPHGSAPIFSDEVAHFEDFVTTHEELWDRVVAAKVKARNFRDDYKARFQKEVEKMRFVLDYMKNDLSPIKSTMTGDFTLYLGSKPLFSKLNKGTSESMRIERQKDNPEKAVKVASLTEAKQLFVSFVSDYQLSSGNLSEKTGQIYRNSDLFAILQLDGSLRDAEGKVIE